MSAILHWLPLAATLLAWFASTALVAWLAHRPARGRRSGLIAAAAVGIGGMLAVIVTAGDSGAAAAYISFLGALAVWGWLELAFLTGAVTGPRRRAAEPGARFAQATAAVIHHELTLAVAMLMLAAVSWGAVNTTGAAAFALLFGLRLSAKLNIFIGVPNFSDELLPARLAYLKSYFGPVRLHPALVVSILLGSVLTAWLGARALASPSAGASLLFALAALGVIEHLFLALPVRDGALWRWVLPVRPERA